MSELDDIKSKMAEVDFNNLKEGWVGIKKIDQTIVLLSPSGWIYAPSMYTPAGVARAASRSGGSMFMNSIFSL